MTEIVFRPLGEAALLVELGETVDQAVNERVIAVDAALRAAVPIGLSETVPAFASLMILFDPVLTDMAAIEAAAREAALHSAAVALHPTEHVVPVCYDGDYAPDIETLGDTLGLSPDALAECHAAGDYRVYMYGFAPGFAYLGGVPERLRVSRKAAAVRGHEAGSVIIAAGQCIVMPLAMPTGWWVIGRTAARILRPELDEPFLFKPGDRVRFERIGRAEFERQLAG